MMVWENDWPHENQTHATSDTECVRGKCINPIYNRQALLQSRNKRGDSLALLVSWRFKFSTLSLMDSSYRLAVTAELLLHDLHGQHQSLQPACDARHPGDR